MPETTEEAILRISAETSENELVIAAAMEAAERQLSRVVQQLEAKLQLARQKEAEAKRRREPQAKIIIQRKAQTRQRVQEIREQVQADPRNGDLQWQLARQVAGIDLPQVLDDNDLFWRHVDFWLPVTPNIDEARSIVELALSLGISDLATSARAHYLYFILSISTKVSSSVSGGRTTLVDDDMTRRITAAYIPTKHVMLRKLLEEVPGSKTHCEAIMSDTRRYLERNPRDLAALHIRREIALILGRKDQGDKMDAAIAQVLRLQEAGLASDAVDMSIVPQDENGRNDGQDLETLTRQLLTAMGLKTTATKTTGDGGIDLVAVSESPVFSGTYIVQCKDWKNPVGEPIVRDLYGVVTSERANKGILIATGGFTPAAARFAEGKQLELIDGAGLAKLLKQFNLSWTQRRE